MKLSLEVVRVFLNQLIETIKALLKGNKKEKALYFLWEWTIYLQGEIWSGYSAQMAY